MATPQYKTIKKDRLFFGRWSLCVNFYLEEATALKSLSHDCIDDSIERRRQWRQIYTANPVRLPGITQPWTVKKTAISEQCVLNLHKVCQYLTSEASIPFKLVCTDRSVYVYSNDSDFLQGLGDLSCVKNAQFTKALVDREENTIKLKASSYNTRTYMKNLKLSKDQKGQLHRFLAQQQVRISPAMQTWLTGPLLRTQDYFFIDHEGDCWLTMLALVHSGLVRKSMKIQVA